MIAPVGKLRAQALQDKFLELLPQIRIQARVAFGHENPERREELVAEHGRLAARRAMRTSAGNHALAAPDGDRQKQESDPVIDVST